MFLIIKSVALFLIFPFSKHFHSHLLHVARSWQTCSLSLNRFFSLVVILARNNYITMPLNWNSTSTMQRIRENEMALVHENSDWNSMTLEIAFGILLPVGSMINKAIKWGERIEFINFIYAPMFFCSAQCTMHMFYLNLIEWASCNVFMQKLLLLTNKVTILFGFGHCCIHTHMRTHTLGRW